ncbi:hypothetical protein GGF31_007630 [Allomyces arbusculus]|nr:hypothetical protein GGF31_007630 [Allomyces arbusculus]
MADMVDTMVSHAQDLVQHVVEVKLPPKDVLTLVKNDAASKSLFGVRAVRTARFDTKVKEPLALMRPEPPVIVAPAFTPTVPPPMISVTHPEQLEMVPPELDVTAPPMVLPEQAPPVQQWVGVETAQLIVDEIQNNAE